MVASLPLMSLDPHRASVFTRERGLWRGVAAIAAALGKEQTFFIYIVTISKVLLSVNTFSRLFFISNLEKAKSKRPIVQLNTKFITTK